MAFTEAFKAMIASDSNLQSPVVSTNTEHKKPVNQIGFKKPYRTHEPRSLLQII